MRVRLHRGAQREVAAQRKPGQRHRPVRPALRDVAQRMHHLVDAAGMEQRLVEAMAVAVITEVQPEDVPAVGEQATAGLQYIGGIDAAFPAVEQHGQPA